MSPYRFKPLPSDDCDVFGAWLNVLLIRSEAPEREETYALAEKNLASILRTHPRGVAILLNVMHSERPPSDYLERASLLLRTFRPQLTASVAVIDAEGFASATQRAVGVSLIRLAGLGSVASLVATPALAVDFLAPKIFGAQAMKAESAALLAAVEWFRQAPRELVSP